mgnify:FL=1
MKKIFYIIPRDIIISAFIVLILASNLGTIIGIMIWAVWILYIVLSMVKANKGNRSRYLIKYCPCWKKNYVQIFMNDNWWIQRVAMANRLKQFVSECYELYESIPEGTIIEFYTHKTIVNRIIRKNPRQIFVTPAYVDSMKFVSGMLKIKNTGKKQFYHVLIEK